MHRRFPVAHTGAAGYTRLLAVLSALTVLLAACGGSADDAADEAAGDTAGDDAAAAESDPVSGETSAVDETSGSDNGSAGGAAAELPPGWPDLLDELRCADTGVGQFPRTVAHDDGETVIESEPRRVVSIEGTTSLDVLLLMGVTPAAAGANYEDPLRIAPWQAVLTTGDRAAPGFDLIRKRPEVNIEQIAAADPDLIVSQSGWIEDIRGQVEAIGAPIVIFDWSDEVAATDWRDSVRIVGEAVGRDACVDEIIGEVEAKIAETREAVAGAGTAQQSFTVVTVGDGYIAYHGERDPIGQALHDEIGLELAPSDGGQTEFAVETAGEVLVGDTILAFDYGESLPFDRSFLEEPTVTGVADRFVVMPEVVSNAGYYPSALGRYLWLDWFAERFGAG